MPIGMYANDPAGRLKSRPSKVDDVLTAQHVKRLIGVVVDVQWRAEGRRLTGLEPTHRLPSLISSACTYPRWPRGLCGAGARARVLIGALQVGEYRRNAPV